MGLNWRAIILHTLAELAEALSCELRDASERAASGEPAPQHIVIE